MITVALLYVVLSMPPTEAIKQVLSDEFKPEVVEDIMLVSSTTDTDPLVVSRIVKAESGGRYDILRYCKKWDEDRKKCIEEASCWKNCRRAEVWNNRLDLGLWGLRDAPSTSWFTWYEKVHKTKLPKYCGIERKCSRKIAIFAIRYMKSVPPRKCHGNGYEAWLTRWNSCNSYRKRVELARKLYEVVYRIALLDEGVTKWQTSALQ